MGKVKQTKRNSQQDKGNLEVSVVDVCNGDSIENTNLKAGSLTGVTDSSGKFLFKKLSIGGYGIVAEKNYPDKNYLTFIIHYPKITISHKAKSEHSETAEIEAGKTTKIEIKLKVFKKVNKVVFKRLHIGKSISGTEYGHWWVEIDDAESFGWWPKYPLGSPENASSQPPTPPSPLPADASITEKIQNMADTAVYQVKKLIYEMRENAPVRTLMGVEGELNGQTSFGGSDNEDPHHDDSANERYQPIIDDCRTDSEIKSCIKDFAKIYEANTKTWSWRFEFGNHCHSFQIEMITHCDLNKLKEI